MFVSTHYAGKDVAMEFEEGEAWTKVFGPIFVYLNSVSSENKNSVSSENNLQQLWENAKEQVYI